MVKDLVISADRSLSIMEVLQWSRFLVFRKHVLNELEHVVAVPRPQFRINHKERGDLNVYTEVVEEKLLVVLRPSCRLVKRYVKLPLSEHELPIHGQIGPLDLIIVQLQFLNLIIAQPIVALFFREHLKLVLCLLQLTLVHIGVSEDALAEVGLRCGLHLVRARFFVRQDLHRQLTFETITDNHLGFLSLFVSKSI